MKKQLQFTVVLLVIASSFCKAQVFYGMTNRGGSKDSGTIISFNPATNKDSVVWSFGSSPSDGTLPNGNLVYDPANGLFYGMTLYGGNNKDSGTIISFNPTDNTESVVYNFGKGKKGDGAQPLGSLVYDANNELFYGMTNRGGANKRGSIFSFNPANNSENPLWSFGSGMDGAFLIGNLVYDSGNGLFYGMTFTGGTNGNGDGIIFSFNPASNTENVVWNFGSGTDGTGPEGSLIYDAGAGLLYGMTFSGGSFSGGTIFNFNTTTNKDSVLWSLGSGKDGSGPEGSLVYDAGYGEFYGTTIAGGSTGFGAIISFNPVTNKDSVVWNFATGTDGYSPSGSLVYDAANKLFYGMTYSGGTNFYGTIFSFNPTGNAESVVWNFNGGKDGERPYGDLLLYTSATGINTVSDKSATVNIYPNPTSGQFTVKLNDNQTDYSVEVYNVIGEQVYQSVLHNAQNVINLSTQPEGVYFVQVKSEKGVAVEKILVTK